MVDAVNERSKRHHYKPAPLQQRPEMPGSAGENVLFIGNSTVLFQIPGADGKIHYMNYTKFGLFVKHLPLDQREKFQATIIEGQLLSEHLFRQL